MCGICGFTWSDRALVEAMARALAHRGPDQDGFFVSDDVSLGHRRLSIIDLSEHGRQPMTNEDRTVQLVFNGEIYNFQELRRDLLAKGHAFVSRSDSEVIVHAYEEYGIEAIGKLRGMFAFAIWDSRNRSLLLVRDRIGIKPLYYHRRNGRLVFASEIKAILEVPSVPRELNPQALYDYLGFEFVPAPATMFRDIFKLPAGHYLLFRDGQANVRRYWDLAMGGNTLPYHEAVERERELLGQAVKSHLVSDVPLGVFLSGGLDSSALVAMMRRHISGRLRTFTIGYPDETFSELEYARQVADVFATDHHVLMIEDLKPDHIETAVWHLDEPMTDLSTIPLMLVCRKAREHITVCLSGEGGDESFAGYDRFKASRLNRWCGLVPGRLRRGVIGPLVARLPDQPRKKGAINMLKRFIEGSVLPPEGRHLRWQYFSSARHEQQLFTPDFRARLTRDPFRQVREYAERCSDADTVNREIYLDMRFMMTDSVLMKVDKMSMASSLEIRVPLLDHVFVEFMAGLPGDWKLKGLRTKRVFRSALKGILPDNILNRGKQGYSLPVKHLLRGQLRDYMTRLLNESPLIRKNLDIRHVNRLIQEHLAMVHNHNHTLWALMTVALWRQRFKVEG
ncbi:MAG: asparagine synthase (glutamine-hydrolyzing) [Verrucomicrobiota bacterium]|nr:asparagine synthase (glutamine-hydrolyzing) [Verrucomicrobiota bacterium]